MSVSAALILLVVFVCVASYLFTVLKRYLEKDSQNLLMEELRVAPAPLMQVHLYELCEWVKVTQKPVLKISRVELWALIEMAKQLPNPYLVAGNLEKK